MSDKQMVTAEDLVRAIQNDIHNDGYKGVGMLAALLNLPMSFYDGSDVSSVYQINDWIHAIANLITLPNPTITGTINGEAATFEVVYRGD